MRVYEVLEENEGIRSTGKKMRVYEVLEENDVIRKILLTLNTSKITLDLDSPYTKTYVYICPMYI